MMYQPDLEDALDAACRELNRVDVRPGCTVTAIMQSADVARIGYVHDGAPHSMTARFVIGCDGGGSFTRDHLGLTQFDYGFSEPWMVCDFALKHPVELPMARQVGDPTAPTSIISIGLRHHRFSFMLDSADDFGEQSEPARVCGGAAGDSDRAADAELIRVATYTFRSLVADRWRAGSVLLAGDARTPDAAVPRTGHVLGNPGRPQSCVQAGPSAPRLRQPFGARHLPDRTGTARAHGHRDRSAARSAAHAPRPRRGGRTRPRDAPGTRFRDGPGQGCCCPAGPGLLSVRHDLAAGHLSAHGIVAMDGRQGLLDELAGGGFCLLATGAAAQALSADGTGRNFRTPACAWSSYRRR